MALELWEAPVFQRPPWSGLSINRSTCYATASGLLDLIQASLMCREGNEWALIPTACPSGQAVPLTDRLRPGEAAALLLFTGLQWKKTATEVFVSTATGGRGLTSEDVAASQHASPGRRTSAGHLLGRGTAQRTRGLGERKGKSRPDRPKNQTSEALAPGFSGHGA